MSRFTLDKQDRFSREKRWTRPRSLGAYGEEVRRMLERVVDIRFARYGTILEELEVVCCMTGFRLRVLVEYTADGSCRLEDLGPW